MGVCRRNFWVDIYIRTSDGGQEAAGHDLDKEVIYNEDIESFSLDCTTPFGRTFLS